MKENSHLGKDVQKVLKSLQENGIAQKQLQQLKAATGMNLAGMNKSFAGGQNKTIFIINDLSLLGPKIPQANSNVQIPTSPKLPDLPQKLQSKPSRS